jgi:predicted DNA-binding transcriptional regulator AlpA
VRQPSKSQTAAPLPEFAVQLLTDREVGAMLRVHPGTIWRWVSEGRLPKPVRVADRATRWFRSDIEAHVAALAQARDADVHS